MLGRLIAKSLWNQRGRVVWVFLSVATAAALSSAFLTIAFQITEGMARELRSYGANILLVPASEPLEVEIGGLRHVLPEEAAYLEEADLPKIKSIFWRHNVVAFAPFLSRIVDIGARRALLVGTWFEKEIAVPRGKRMFTFAGGAQRQVAPEERTFRTGVKALDPWWRVEGSWVGEGEEAALVGGVLGKEISAGMGSRVRVSYEGRSALLTVRGIVRTGGAEEDQLFVPLRVAQKLFGLPGKVEGVRVSALVTPDNALAARAARIGPSQLPPKEFETWYCTPYLSSILYQLEEAIPHSKGKAVRRVSEAEGAFLGKMTLTFLLTAGVAFAAAFLGVAATTARGVFERRREIGLMKALGAKGRQISLLFLLEGGVSGLIGGLLGYLGGRALARLLAALAFSVERLDLSPSLEGMVLSLTLTLAVGVALLGSWFPVRGAARMDPARTLSGD
ncbi:MAG: FtsX-like permease family protein [Candidatus Tectomicrobia bacterium]|nr:FtsX-like permease family protein [Candidatus Tectomicrobia bacterium]